MTDNSEFCEQIGAAIIQLGTHEALSCMARMLAAVAQHQGSDIQFDCLVFRTYTLVSRGRKYDDIGTSELSPCSFPRLPLPAIPKFCNDSR